MIGKCGYGPARVDQFEQVKSAVDALPEESQRLMLAWLRSRYPVHALEQQFGTTAEVILEAISRSSDISQRGVLGLIAEASFQLNVIDKLEGWTDAPPDSEQAFDFRIRRGTEEIRIQVKRQRLESLAPMRYRRSDFYVAETQRSRSGTNRATGQATRPYRFGDFDILAVSMQPVTRDWASFRFTPQRWLIPRGSDANLLQVYQPVSLTPNEDWSDNLSQAIDWHRSNLQRRIAER